MNPGEAFEIRCYEYLKSLYAEKNVDFDRKGGMNSTESDIAVIKGSHVDYFIEAKDTSAQSGQFVLLPNEENHEFVFSPKNKSEQNEMTDIIIEYMNQDFHRFNNAGTSGEKLDIDSSVFAEWIIGHYKDRQVKYVISEYHNDYIVLPIRRFAAYFDILANFRIKKSGSGAPAQKDFQAVKQLILSVYPNAIFEQADKKLFATITTPVSQNRFDFGKNTIYLSDKGNGLFEVKRLSNTYNMNVIFSIHAKQSQDKADLDEFESDL